MLYNSDFRSVRLDAFASDAEQIRYNMEMQNYGKVSLAKRSRYNQAKLDVTSLKPGEDFRELKTTYVIFICTFDPFGRGLYRYTFDNRCLERDFSLEDGARRIFLNTKGKNSQEIPAELVDFLHYVEDSSDACAELVKDDRIRALHQNITQLKKSRDLEVKYMTIGEWVEEEKQMAREEARAEAKAEQERMLKLVIRMNAEGKIGQLIEVQEKQGCLDGLYQIYNL